MVYKFICANGKESQSRTNICYTYNRHCPAPSNGGSSGGGSPVTWNVSPGGGGNGTTSATIAPEAQNMQGAACYPDAPRKECFCEPCGRKTTCIDSDQETGSTVNLLMREYTREDTDLFVKVPGGNITISRRFFDNRWQLDPVMRLMAAPSKVNMTAIPISSNSNIISSFIRNGVAYNIPETAIALKIEHAPDGSIHKKAYVYTGEVVFRHEAYTIIPHGDGYQWQAPDGRYEIYDTHLRITSYGNRNGIIGKLLYDANEKLTGMADRNDRQVIWFEYDESNQIIAVRDMGGRRVEYGYTEGKLGVVKDLLGNTTTFTYDTIKGGGRSNTQPVKSIVEFTDANNRVFTITYDARGDVRSVLDQNQSGYTFAYDYDKTRKEYYAKTESTTGRLKEVWYDRNWETNKVQINGRVVKRVEKEGNTLTHFDENGNVTKETYDSRDNVTEMVYSDGSRIKKTYEYTFNRITETTNENNVTTQFEYDEKGRLIQKTEAVGTDVERITQYTYDTDSNLLTITLVGDDVTDTAVTTMTYDESGNLASITDGENNVTQFTDNDAMGNVLRKNDARGKLWQYAYDESGQITSATDPLGHIIQFFYDAIGNKTKEIDPEGNEMLFEYDERDQMVKAINTVGETRFEYTFDGRLLKQIDPEGKEITYLYDAEGRMIKTIDGNGNEIEVKYNGTTSGGCATCSDGGSAYNQPDSIQYPTFEKQFSYDKRGRKVMETDVLGELNHLTTRRYYDGAGNLITQIDKEEKTTQYAYDALDRLTTVTDALNGITRYTYDNRDNLIALTDVKNQTTRFEYDKYNRQVKEIRPMGQETTYTYDPAGNLAAKFDAKNQKTEYGYDDAGRLTGIKYFSALDHTVAVKTVTFTFDKVGNLKSYNDGITSATYTYDALHRKTQETVNYGSFEKSYSYTYYKNGLKQSFTGPDNITYAYTYDANNQIIGVEIPNIGFITINEYHWNRPKSIILPGGTTKTYTYDPLMRMASINAQDPGKNTILNYTYTYDRMDNITQKNTEHGNYGYAYDDLYRLTQTDNPDFDDEAFTYDGVGNRLTLQGVTGDWSYNKNNELLAYAENSFQYDPNGNMTQKTESGQIMQFIYNTEDRLERVEDASSNLIGAYYYDPFGRRLWKEVDGKRIYFFYTDEGLNAEFDENGSEIKAYGFKPNAIWTTDPLFMKVGAEYYFYHTDHLGTPHKMTAVSGGLVWGGQYEAFGNLLINSNPYVENNLRFAGQYIDQETSHHYNYHRYYDPTIGRYPQADPIGLEGGINLYSYAQNDPINKIDVTGMNVVVPSPGGPILIPIPPPPIVTFPTVGTPWQPNTPNQDPSPGDKFKLCMAACKVMLKKTLKCPTFLGSAPCSFVCIVAAFGGGED